MKLISHRGNINGRNPEFENNPNYIQVAIEKGYDVEIDVWRKDGYIFLGHDYPQFKINYDWLLNRIDHFWVHCKDISSLEFFSNDSSFNYFWHEEDTVTLTSHGYIWAYPGKQPIKNSIAVMPEIHGEKVEDCLGVCSDFIESFKS